MLWLQRCVVLSCAMLYCALLYCTVLCCPVGCLQEILVVADAEMVKAVTVKKSKIFRIRPGP